MRAATAAPNTLAGEVITHTFLGSVTRLKVVGRGSELIADVPSATAAELPVGTRVTATLPAADAQLLDLTDERPEVPEEPVPAGR